MKKLSYVFAGLALVASAAFTSCEKDPAPVADEGLKSIALSINFGGVGTKTEVTPDAPWGNKFKTYEYLDLYFASATNNILYYYHAAPDASGNGLTIWNNLLTTSTTTKGSGVKFLGMEGVNRVFVVANGPQIAGLAAEGVVDETTGKVTGQINISDLNDGLTLDKYSADANQEKMIYAGATFSLKEATAVSANAAEITIGDKGAVDYEATITIRPAVSRLEVNDVAVTSGGHIYFTLDTDGNYVQSDEVNGKYRVEYSGFEPSLVGVYMSNVYRTSPLFPQQTEADAGQLFATPTDVGAIEKGEWVSLASENTFANNLEYSNYAEGTGYASLIPADYIGTSTNNVLTLFDGDKTPDSPKVIPFNFFVPYDITDESTTSTALSGTVIPALHFQFTTPASFTVGKVEEKISDTWTEITDQTSIDIKNLVEWPDAISSAESGIAFANVVKFYTDADHGTTADILPGYIYKVQQVLVSPVNLEITAKKINTYNVAVVVTVVPYTTQNVYPGFE